MRSWIVRLLVVAMLANLAVWSSPELAESMEQLSGTSQPLDAPQDSGPDNCQHGCAGHCGSHVQWQAGTLFAFPAAADPVAVPSARYLFLTGAERSLPFRPPLGNQLT
jgi:hypothetical protein